MRIKTYSAPSMEKAINKLRLEMGPEAIILSTQNAQNGDVQITAAVEQPESPAPATPDGWAVDWDKDWKAEAKNSLTAELGTNDSKAASPKKRSETNGASRPAVRVSPKMELLVQSMAYHGIPTLLAEKLCRTALAAKTKDTTIALAAALDSHFNYSSRISGRKTPLMLVGPPGVGKTVTLAKIAFSLVTFS